MKDIITITIGAEGLIKVETDKVSQPNHMNATMFLRDIGRLVGGKVESKHKHGHAHTHTHEHEHVEH